MSTVINPNYSQFYRGTEVLKNYGSNSTLKKDTLVKYAFNTTDEDGSKIMDKMSKEEMFQAMKDIRSQYGDDVIVQFSGDGLAALVGNKYSGEGPDLDKIMNREQRAIPEDMVTQLEGTHQIVSENGKIDTRLDWHETLREKAPGVCDEFDDLMQRILDHALNHSDDGESFAKEFIEMVTKAEKAIAASNVKEPAAADTSKESVNGDDFSKGSEAARSKYSAEEILSEINKYANEGETYVIWHSGDTYWLQGIRNGEAIGEKKYFDLNELLAALGKGNEKSISVSNNTITINNNSYYKFTGKDGKEHTVLSVGGALHTGLLGRSSYDKEAADFVNFWNALGRENPSGVNVKFSNEEIRSRLADAGIQNGFFTVNFGGRTVTHYLSQGENSLAVHSKQQYDNRYHMLTSEHFLSRFEVGHKFMIGGKEYILGEDKKLDIEYGVDVFDFQTQAPASAHSQEENEFDSLNSFDVRV